MMLTVYRIAKLQDKRNKIGKSQKSSLFLKNKNSNDS